MLPHDLTWSVSCEALQPSGPVLQDAIQAAERYQTVLGLLTAPAGSPANDEEAEAPLALAAKEWAAAASPASRIKAEANGHVTSSDAQLAAADMAAGWSRLASVADANQHTIGYALAGLAASVLVCGCPRYTVCSSPCRGQYRMSHVAEVK